MGKVYSMVIKYLDSKRLEGVAGDLTATPVIGVGGWKEIGRTTLGSANADCAVSGLSDKRYYMVLFDQTAGQSGSADPFFRFNTDTGSNYAGRVSDIGGADAVTVNQSDARIGGHPAGTTGNFGVGYVTNLLAKEKLALFHEVGQNTAGAGAIPYTAEGAIKWANTSAAISNINVTTSTGATWTTGTEVVVLGWDETDTHTDNFWEPLGSTTLATAGDNIEVTFTAKKYLMVKLYRKPTGAANARWTFNNDGGANYAKRKSSDGSTDSTSEGLNQNYFTQYTYDNSEPSYSSTIIVNTAGAEKLGTQHEMTPLGAGANAVHRSESVFKWANTSDQITTIDITNSKSGSYDVGSIIEVWGHD